MRKSIQEWTKQIKWKTAFKNLLCPILNTLRRMKFPRTDDFENYQEFGIYLSDKYFPKILHGYFLRR